MPHQIALVDDDDADAPQRQDRDRPATVPRHRLSMTVQLATVASPHLWGAAQVRHRQDHGKPGIGTYDAGTTDARRRRRRNESEDLRGDPESVGTRHERGFPANIKHPRLDQTLRMTPLPTCTTASPVSARTMPALPTQAGQHRRRKSEDLRGDPESVGTRATSAASRPTANIHGKTNTR